MVEGRDYGASEKLLSRLKDEKSWSPITTIVGIQEWFAFTKDVNRRAIHDPDNVGSPAYGWPFGYGSIILGTRPHYAGKGVLNTY